MNGAIVRIILRYLSGGGLSAALFGAGLPAFSPDVILVASGILAAITEGYYYFAKKHGWPT